MRMRTLALTAAVALAAFALPRAADAPYRFIKDVQIGGDGGWDYLNLDGAGRRLLISHGTKVVVFDLKSDAVVGEIADTPGVHGAVMASEGHIFTSNGRENKASMVDAKTLQTIQKIETPYRVVINEAVELAKSFGGVDGHKYVNGVLDKLAAELRRPEFDAAKQERASRRAQGDR